MMLLFSSCLFFVPPTVRRIPDSPSVPSSLLLTILFLLLKKYYASTFSSSYPGKGDHMFSNEIATECSDFFGCLGLTLREPLVFGMQISFSDWFLSKGGTRTSIQRMWDPVAYALGFIDCDNISARCMLTIFSLFATKTEASLLRMLKGSPDVYLSGPIRDYITEKGGRYASLRKLNVIR